MSIPKSQFDRIIDSVERMLDKVGKSYVDSGDCDLETFTQQLMPGSHSLLAMPLRN